MGANLKETRNRIKSIQSTQQITKAMKMVAAAKLRKAQQGITQLRPYSDKLDAMLRNIMSATEGDSTIAFGKEREVNNALLVVTTSDRGLCGAFNSNVFKAVKAAIEGEFAAVRAAGKLSILCIGKKGFEHCTKRYEDCTIISDHVDLFKKMTFDKSAKVSQMLMGYFLDGEYDLIKVAYGKFINAATQEFNVVPFLPVVQEEVEATEKADNKYQADFLFEPNKDKLLAELVPSILKTQFYKYLLDTDASQHGARMVAMEAATENANELIRDLKIVYNKARQEVITNQILEIVGGAAALEN